MASWIKRLVLMGISDKIGRSLGPGSSVPHFLSESSNRRRSVACVISRASRVAKLAAKRKRPGPELLPSPDLRENAVSCLSRPQQPAADQLHSSQAEAQQRDRRAAIGHALRGRASGEAEDPVGRGSLRGEIPHPRGRIEPVAGNGPRPSDAEEVRTLKDHRRGGQVIGEPAHRPETGSRSRGAENPRRTHRHARAHSDRREVPIAALDRDVRKVVHPGGRRQ